MIGSGRCHGPDCTKPAVVEFWCGEVCQGRWNAQAEGRTEPHPTSADLAAALAVGEQFRDVDLAPFRDALDRTVRALAEVSELPAGLVDPEAPTSADSIRVAWRDPELPAISSRLAALADIPPAMLAVDVPFYPGARMAAEVELLNARLRTVFRDHAEAAVAEAQRRANSSFSTYAQAVESMWSDPPEFASANAASPQVAPKDPQVGFLGRAFHWLFGRTS